VYNPIEPHRATSFDNYTTIWSKQKLEQITPIPMNSKHNKLFSQKLRKSN